MNYKKIKNFLKFDINKITVYDVVEFFSLARHKSMYFFDGNKYIGLLTKKIFKENNFKLSKEVLFTLCVSNYNNYIDDHRKLYDFFLENKFIHSTLIFNDNEIFEITLIDKYDKTFKTQKKIDALKKLIEYSDIFQAFIEEEFDNNVAIVIPKGYERFVPNFLQVTSLDNLSGYKYILDSFIFEDAYPIFEEHNLICLDEALAMALLRWIKNNSNINNIYFFNEPIIDKDELYLDELEMLSYTNISEPFNNTKYIDKTYKDYPLDLEYLNFVGKNIYNSFVLTNYGVYRSIKESTIKGDFDTYRITPSNKGYESKLYLYGPCTAYSLFTSRYSSVTERLQQIINNKKICFDVINSGVPDGGDILNDILRMVYLSDKHINSIHIFISGYSEFVINMIKRYGYNFNSTTLFFNGHHYFFFNEIMHLTPYGTNLLAHNIFKLLDFTKINKMNHLSFLVRNVKDERYFVKDNDIEKYKKYLFKCRFEQDGKKGFMHINASPLTYGHCYLIDYAVNHCDYLYVMVVEDNPNAFPFHDRYNLIKEYCSKYKNVKVITGSLFLGSKYTYSAYFNKKVNMKNDPEIDVKNFDEIIMPILKIDVRFMGTEENSQITLKLNEAYIRYMNSIGKELVVVPRKELDNVAISASSVRLYTKERNYEKLKQLVPTHVLKYLMNVKPEEVAEG